MLLIVADILRRVSEDVGEPIAQDVSVTSAAISQHTTMPPLSFDPSTPEVEIPSTVPSDDGEEGKTPEENITEEYLHMILSEDHKDI